MFSLVPSFTTERPTELHLAKFADALRQRLRMGESAKTLSPQDLAPEVRVVGKTVRIGSPLGSIESDRVSPSMDASRVGPSMDVSDLMRRERALPGETVDRAVILALNDTGLLGAVQ